MTGDDLRYLGRRAMAVAHALEGIPLAEEVVYEVPYARIWPARMAVEVGIPDGVLYDQGLPLGTRLLWVVMWRLVHVSAVRPRVRVRAKQLSLLLGSSVETIWNWLRRLQSSGWASVQRAPPPSSYGEIEVELYLVQRPPVVDADEAPAQGAELKAIDTTAIGGE